MATNRGKITKRNGVATVRFDRGVRRNALDTETILALTDVARGFETDTKTRAVVLTGAADVFSAGIDLREEARWNGLQGAPAEQRFIGGQGRRLLEAWEEIPQLTIAAIEGFAVGGGVVLVSVCDWRVMAEDAFLLVPEIEIGLNLGWGALPRLVNLVGPARAKRIAILCERIDAATALDWGLIDEIVPKGKTLAAARKMAARAASMPTLAAQMTKETVNRYANALLPLTQHMDIDQGASIRNSPEAVAARKNFRKQKPRKR